MARKLIQQTMKFPVEFSRGVTYLMTFYHMEHCPGLQYQELLPQNSLSRSSASSI
jgi:hypothetical protein